MHSAKSGKVPKTVSVPANCFVRTQKNDKENALSINNMGIIGYTLALLSLNVNADNKRLFLAFIPILYIIITHTYWKIKQNSTLC